MFPSRIRPLPLLALGGAALLVLGIVVGYRNRDAGTDPAATILGVLGAVVALASAGLALVQERRPRGLHLPPAPHPHHQHLPDYDWWAPVGLTGLAMSAVGALASPWLGVVGGLVVLGAFIGLIWMLRTRHGVLDRRCVLGARRIADFAERHTQGGDATVKAGVEHVSRGRWRIVLVAADGTIGDVLARSKERTAMMIHLAGAQQEDPKDRAFGAAMRTSHYEWDRMTGSQLAEPWRG